MKKVVYLAPIFLLSFLGKNAMADQVEHVSKLDEALKQEAIAESNIAAQNTTVEQTQANPKISTNLLNTKRDNNSVADINTYTASKINAQKSDPIVINNPAGDKVNVHYVNRDGGAITDPNVKDTTIDVTKTGQGSYQVPSGYNLNNPSGKYDVTTHPYDGPNNVKVTGGSINHVAPKSPDDNSDYYNMGYLNQYNKIHVKFVDQNTGKAVGGDYDIDLAKAVSGSYTLPNGYTTNNDTYSVQKHDEVMGYDHDNTYLMWLQNVLPKNTYNVLRTSMLNIYEQSQNLHPGYTNPDISIEYAGIFNHRSDISDPFAYSGSDHGVEVPDMNWLKSAPDNELVADVITGSSSFDGAIGTYYQLPASIRFDSDLGNLIHKHGDTASGFSSPLDPKNNASMEFHVETVSTFSDSKNNVSGDTVTVPVHKINSYEFIDNSGNVKSYSGNTVNVILEHQTKRIDPNNSSLNLDANNQLHLINTSQAQPKQSTANFKVGYLLDLVTNNEIIDTNNAQALNNTKIFTVNPSLPIGYDALNTKLLTLNL